MNARETSTFLAMALVVGMFAACGSDNNNDNNNTGNSNNTSNSNTASCPNGTVTQADIDAAFTSSPNACSGQMYTKYQDAGFQAVNSAIIGLALDANQVKNIGSSFQDKLANANDTRKQEFTTNLGTFLEAAYGNTDAHYTGPEMVKAHGDLYITIAQYQGFIEDVVVPALAGTKGVDPNDISNCFAPVVTDPNFVATIVTCK